MYIDMYMFKTWVWIWFVHSDTTTFLKNYQHQRSVKTAFSNLELDHLQRHLQVELQRQNALAATSKQQCEVKMKRVVKVLAMI